jgi:hypothetical protein
MINSTGRAKFLIQHREAPCAAVGHHLLLSCCGMLSCRACQLHQHNCGLQPSRSISTERLEDTDSIHDSLRFNHRDLHTIPCYKRREGLDESVMLVYFVDTACLLSQRAQYHAILSLYLGIAYSNRSPSKILQTPYSGSSIAQVESSTVV